MILRGGDAGCEESSQDNKVDEGECRGGNGGKEGRITAEKEMQVEGWEGVEEGKAGEKEGRDYIRAIPY